MTGWSWAVGGIRGCTCHRAAAPDPALDPRTKSPLRRPDGLTFQVYRLSLTPPTPFCGFSTPVYAVENPTHTYVTKGLPRNAVLSPG
jgi:hypothetical protein